LIHPEIHVKLNKIFNKETVDLIHVSERIEAAFVYFLKPMDALVLKSFETRRGEAHQKKSQKRFMRS
jgi:hypothetical protein